MTEKPTTTEHQNYLDGMKDKKENYKYEKYDNTIIEPEHDEPLSEELIKRFRCKKL